MYELCVDIQSKYWKKCQENKQLKKQIKFLTQLLEKDNSYRQSKKRKPLREESKVP